MHCKCSRELSSRIMNIRSIPELTKTIAEPLDIGVNGMIGEGGAVVQIVHRLHKG